MRNHDTHDSSIFANRGSALRRASRHNPRDRPCPTCREPNKLTPAEEAYRRARAKPTVAEVGWW